MSEYHQSFTDFTHPMLMNLDLHTSDFIGKTQFEVVCKDSWFANIPPIAAAPHFVKHLIE